MTTIYCLAYAFLGGLIITVGYHRLLGHRSFETHKWLEYLLATLGLPTGTPLQWVSTHRAHHAFSDREGDPHSIHVQGFWYAQVGKYIGTNRPLPCILYSLAGPLRILINGYISPRIDKQYYKFGRDIANDPYYRWLAKPTPFLMMSVAHFAMTMIPIYLIEGWPGVWGLYATIVIMYNIGDSSDTVSHWYGSRLPNQTHKATNLLWYSLLVWGDGWHANHHNYPESARHGLLPGQVDGAWQFIHLLERLGLAWKIKLPSSAEIKGLSAS